MSLRIGTQKNWWFSRLFAFQHQPTGVHHAENLSWRFVQVLKYSQLVHLDAWKMHVRMRDLPPRHLSACHTKRQHETPKVAISLRATLRRIGSLGDLTHATAVGGQNLAPLGRPRDSSSSIMSGAGFCPPTVWRMPSICQFSQVRNKGALSFAVLYQGFVVEHGVLAFLGKHPGISKILDPRGKE